MRYSFSSFWLSLITNGKLLDILTPWHLVIDMDDQTVTVSKRNWFLIGVDSDTLAFRFIRRITIDQHLIGADITIKAVGGTLTAYCLDKIDAKRIKEILTEYNKQKKGGIVFC